MKNEPDRPQTFADLVKLQPRLAKLERDCKIASRKLLARQKDWHWYEYLKPRLNDLVGLEPRGGQVDIPDPLQNMEVHSLAYDHLYAVLWEKKSRVSRK